MLIHTHNTQTCVIHWYILYDNLTAKIIITINNNALTFLLCFIFRQHVFHEVNILEHNAELSTVKTVQVQQCQCQVYKSLDGLKDVLMQDSIV